MEQTICKQIPNITTKKNAKTIGIGKTNTLYCNEQYPYICGKNTRLSKEKYQGKPFCVKNPLDCDNKDLYEIEDKNSTFFFSKNGNFFKREKCKNIKNKPFDDTPPKTPYTPSEPLKQAITSHFQHSPMTTQQPSMATFQQPPMSTHQQPPMTTFQQPPMTTSQQPPMTTFQQPPMTTFQQPPMTTFQQPPMTTFQQPPMTTFQQPPMSTYQQPITSYQQNEIKQNVNTSEEKQLDFYLNSLSKDELKKEILRLGGKNKFLGSENTLRNELKSLYQKSQIEKIQYPILSSKKEIDCKEYEKQIAEKNILIESYKRSLEGKDKKIDCREYEKQIAEKNSLLESYKRSLEEKDKDVRTNIRQYMDKINTLERDVQYYKKSLKYDHYKKIIDDKDSEIYYYKNKYEELQKKKRQEERSIIPTTNIGNIFDKKDKIIKENKKGEVYVDLPKFLKKYAKEIPVPPGEDFKGAQCYQYEDSEFIIKNDNFLAFRGNLKAGYKYTKNMKKKKKKTYKKYKKY
jgi:hypothetical protein